MFLSAQALAIEYGIDDRIAKFFVDREPPKDNLYWKDKLLYLRPRPGYIFIPLITDLFYRSGISLDILLNENYVGVLEQIGHYSAQQEFGMIGYSEVAHLCSRFVEPIAVDKKNLKIIDNYFENGTNELNSYNVPFSALRRGDVFLYSLSVLDIDQAKFFELVKTWFALISTLLLMDDSEDYLEDLESGEENAFVESGSSKEGFEEIRNMLSSNLRHIESINFSMAQALNRKLISMHEKPGIREYLNA
jgi:hypothetical protein